MIRASSVFSLSHFWHCLCVFWKNEWECHWVHFASKFRDICLIVPIELDRFGALFYISINSLGNFVWFRIFMRKFVRNVIEVLKSSSILLATMGFVSLKNYHPSWRFDAKRNMYRRLWNPKQSKVSSQQPIFTAILSLYFLISEEIPINHCHSNKT